MERASLIPEPLLACAKLTEVPGGLGNDVVIDLDDNSTGFLVGDGDVELDPRRVLCKLTWNVRKADRRT